MTLKSELRTHLDGLPLEVRRTILLLLSFNTLKEVCWEARRDKKFRKEVSDNEVFWKLWLTMHWEQHELWINTQPKRSLRDWAQYYTTEVISANRNKSALHFDPHTEEIEIRNWNTFSKTEWNLLRQNKSLNTISVYSNQDYIENVEEINNMHNLNRLDMSYIWVNIPVIQLIAKNPWLTEVNLKQVRMSNRGAKLLARSKTLKVAYLMKNKISDDGAKFLSKNTILTKLNLSENCIGNVGAAALATNDTLTELSLSENEIEDEGAAAFARNTTLKEIDFRGNPISKDCIDKLCRLKKSTLSTSSR